jgi:very-short-patch-repair endonuclease
MVCTPLGPKLVTVLSDGAFLALTELVSTSDARRLVELAAKQLGVVNRADLASAGVSWKWLRGRLATREWSRVHRGVYRLGCHQPTREERERAALLAVGEGAVLSHTSAARRLGLDVPRDDSVQITIAASRKAKVRGAKVWRSRRLSSVEVTTRGGLRLTNLARTLIDLAWVLDDGWLRACFDSAVRQNRTIVSWVWRALNSHGPGRRGIGRLRALLQEYRRTEEVPDSALESLARDLANRTGHKPRLHYNVLDGAHHVAEVDLAWPKLRLGVECDGWRQHGTRGAFVRDRARDRALFRLGWSVLRYSWDDVVHDPDAFLDELVRSYELRAKSIRAA